MTSRFTTFAAVLLLASGVFTPIGSVAQDAEYYPFATDEFAEVWERSDFPVSRLIAERTWIWGPGPRSPELYEEYAEADGGIRLVQYFDKSRMEFPLTAGADPDSPWFITQGLLATELMTGGLQLGHETFVHYAPADIPVAGDPDDIGGPTYAVMGELMDPVDNTTGALIRATLGADGEVGDDAQLEAYGVANAFFDDVTGHNIAAVFWEFMNSTGTIRVDDGYVQGDIFPDPFYGVGRPRTEAYWGWVKVGNLEQDVLIQCFERRCLTYTPGNDEGWQVESGNIGMHYQTWRYEMIEPDVPEPGDPVLTTFIEHVPMPNAFAFAPDGRMFFVETFEGHIRVVENHELRHQPFATLDLGLPDSHSENGLLGLALHPEFEENGYLYVFYTFSDEDGEPGGNRVARFTDHQSVGNDMTIIIDDLPYGETGMHNSGRLAFGPDGMLYVTTGDIDDPPLSQVPDNLAGSVLRYTPDGAIPNDNPLGPDSPVYAWGLRNPYGIAFHPVTGDMYVTENGPAGYDEVNRIVPGGNYGWPEVQGIAGDPSFVDPIWATTTKRVAPTGITIATGNVSQSDLAGKVLFCQWNTANLIALEIAADNPDEVIGEQIVGVDCQLDVIEGPDGAIYTATSNTIYRWGPPLN